MKEVKKLNQGFLVFEMNRMHVTYAKEALKEILDLEAACFPKSWQYADAEEYYAARLLDDRSIHLFLREGRESIGYLLARPLQDAYGELSLYDAELENDEGCCYLETIGIRPEYSGRGGGSLLLRKLSTVVQQRTRYERISSHVRIKTGLDRLIEKSFPYSLMKKRDIAHWHFGGDEPYRYLKWTV